MRPGGGRWLPTPLRNFFSTCEGAALTASFLASTPVMGMTGLYFDDFATQPPFSKSARKFGVTNALRETFLVRELLALPCSCVSSNFCGNSLLVVLIPRLL